MVRPIPVDARFQPRHPADGTDLPRWDRSTFPPARAAATLLLVYPGEGGELTVPLTERPADMRAHPGEVSLPGGAVEPADLSPAAAALREAHEEIGVEPSMVVIAGRLDPVWIPVSNFELLPFVGMLSAPPIFAPHVAEVAEIVELPLHRLLAQDAVSDEVIEGPGWLLRAAVYRWQGHRIWGATARTLAMFATVLRELPTD